ncbi:MAG: hypothetical protein HYY79_10975 [Betaproteobacteria bacterium]|nr:hypothetical protein [Betaproteobacteria bacterium]
MTFNNTLNSFGANRTLQVNDSGTTTFGGVVGGGLALSSLTTDAPGTTAINSTGVTTTGNQTYNDPVTLGANSTLASTGAGTIQFASTLNGGFALTVNTVGNTIFTGAVGGGPALASLTTDAVGATQINGGSVTTTAAQTYGDPVTLGADTTFTGVNVSFNNTLNSSGANRAVTVNDSGTTIFGGVIGGVLPLASLTTDAPGTTAINTSTTTTGAQIYNDPVILGAATTLTSTGNQAITFNSTVNDDGNGATSSALTVNTGGATTFGGDVGNVAPLTSLTTDAGGTTSLRNVTTTGAQTYNDNVTLNSTYTTTNSDFTVAGTTTLAGASTTINTGTGNVTFTGTVNGASALDITNAGGTTTFSSTVGGVTPLASLTATSGNFSIGAPVTTTGNITLTGTGRRLIAYWRPSPRGASGRWPRSWCCLNCWWRR